MPDAPVDVVLARLAHKRDLIRRAPALPPASLDSLFTDYALRHAHATTALEGNTLTLHEAQEVLEAGTTIPGKSPRTPGSRQCERRLALVAPNDRPRRPVHRPQRLGDSPTADAGASRR